MKVPRLGRPDLGVGVGLRVPHYRHIIETRPVIDFFEIISENFMVAGGKPLFHLERVLESYLVIQHGVSLSIGAPEPPDREYLHKLKQLVRRVKPAWVSDHLCWCGVPGANLHDLLPLPHTEEAIRRVVERAAMVQDFLEVRFALENTSSYMAYTASTMPEWEFVSEIVERADIGLMFDVNNVYVSAYNHGFDPYEYLRSIPHERVVQVHLAGHTNLGKYIIDTHRGQVIDPVWELYAATIEMTGAVSTLIEWDDEIPTWEVLSQEAALARRVREMALRKREEILQSGQTPSLDGRSMPILRQKHAENISAGWVQGGPSEHAAQETTSPA
jgi:uncharacterized protein (UPF0276 family)